MRALSVQGAGGVRAAGRAFSCVSNGNPFQVTEIKRECCLFMERRERESMVEIIESGTLRVSDAQLCFFNVVVQAIV